MGRVEGSQPLQKFIKYLLVGITLCFAVWATPRSIIATVSELRAMGGSTHPILGYFGVMSAKNTGREHPDPHDVHELPAVSPYGKDRSGGLGEEGACGAAPHLRGCRDSSSSSLGVYGYFVEATVRIGLSVPQVSSVLFAMVSITAIDIFLFRGAKKTGEVRWGRMPAISQYV
jgi:hypothetical protein